MPEIYTKPVDKKMPETDIPVSKPVMPSNKTTIKQLLSAFIINPTDIRFETQDKDENILLLMRAHPLTNFSWLLMTFVVLILPTFLLPVLLDARIIPENMPWGYFVIIPLLYYLGVLEYAFTNFLRWYFNVYIVTSKRVVDIDWMSLLYKKLSSAQLDKIQDVTYKQGGLLDSFFNFGNVYIQTAGTEPNFEFEDIPNPDKVVREIQKILDIHSQKHN